MSCTSSNVLVEALRTDLDDWVNNSHGVLDKRITWSERSIAWAHEFSIRWVFHEHCCSSWVRKQEFWGAYIVKLGETLTYSLDTGNQDQWLSQSLPLYWTASTAMSTTAWRRITKNVSESTTPLQTTTHPQFNFGNHLFVTIRVNKHDGQQFRRPTTRLVGEGH